MKKLSLVNLVTSTEVLPHKQMKQVKGGNSWTCYCGSSGGSWDSPEYYQTVYASSS